MTLNCVEVVTTEELGIYLVEAGIAVDVGVEAFERAVKYSNNDEEAIFLRIAHGTAVRFGKLSFSAPRRLLGGV